MYENVVLGCDSNTDANMLPKTKKLLQICESMSSRLNQCKEILNGSDKMFSRTKEAMWMD